MITTHQPFLAEALRVLRNQGMTDRDTWHTPGHNYRMDPLQAIVGSHFIGQTKKWTDTRIAHAQHYDRELAQIPQITLPPRRTHEREVYHLYLVQADNRDALLTHLTAQGVEARVHYPVPLHLQPATRALGYKQGDFPVAETQAKRLLTLPVHAFLTEDQLDYTVACIKEFYL